MKTPPLRLGSYTPLSSNQIGPCHQPRKRHHADMIDDNTKHQATAPSTSPQKCIDTGAISRAKSPYTATNTSSPNTIHSAGQRSNNASTITLISSPSPQPRLDLTHTNMRLESVTPHRHDTSNKPAVLPKNSFRHLLLICEHQRARLCTASPLIELPSTMQHILKSKAMSLWKRTIDTQLPEPIAAMLNNWLENDFLGDMYLKEFSPKSIFNTQYFPKLLMSKKGNIWCQQMRSNSISPPQALESFGHLIAQDIRSGNKGVFANVLNQRKTGSYQRQHLNRLRYTFCVEQAYRTTVSSFMKLTYALAPLPLAVRKYFKEKISNDSQRLANHPDLSLESYCSHMAALLKSKAGRKVIQEIGISTAPKLSDGAAIAHLEKFISYEAKKGARGSDPTTTFLWKIKVLEIHADGSTVPDTRLDSPCTPSTLSAHSLPITDADMPGPSWRVDGIPTHFHNRPAPISALTLRQNTPHIALIHNKNNLTTIQQFHADSASSHPHLHTSPRSLTPPFSLFPTLPLQYKHTTSTACLSSQDRALHLTTIPIRPTVIRPIPRLALSPQKNHTLSNEHTHPNPYLANLFPKMHLSPALDRAAHTAQQINNYHRHIQSILNSSATQ